MSRAWFGGDTLVSTGTNGYLRAVPGELTCWDTETGGIRHTDLLLAGVHVTTIPTISGSVPAFQGPEGVTVLWLDAGAGRVRAVAVYEQILTQLGQGGDFVDLAGPYTNNLTQI